jgi:hypothetical protein
MPTQTDLSRVDPIAREGATIAFLDALPRELAPVLVGGYAIAAYGPPRYSEDVDFVLPAKAEQAAVAWFKEYGLKSRRTLKFEHSGESWSKHRISKGLVSGDVYVGGMQARDSQARVDYGWIARRPERVRLALTTGTTRAPIPVARPEALWVLKLLAGRPQDLTDLFGISDRGVDRSEVRTELSSLLSDSVRTQLEKVAGRVAGDKEYRDALSRRGLGSPSDIRNLRRWHEFQKLAISCIPTSQSD